MFIAIREYRSAIALVGTFATLVVLNGMALFGDEVAIVADNGLQMTAALIAVGCGLAAARRSSGAQRWWRLLIVAGMACWAGGQVIWSWYQIVEQENMPVPSLADVGYLLFPVFALPALFVLAAARSGERQHPQRAWTAHFAFAVALDALIVIGSIFILAWTVALGPILQSTPTTPGALGVALAYPVTDLLMVVTALLLVVFDRVERESRGNFVLLAGGLLALAVSDTIFAYLVSIDAETMRPWADAGFVLGPLLIGLAVLRRPLAADPATELRTDAMEWWQLLLPYACFCAVGLLMSAQLAFADGPDAIESYVSLIVIALIVARQFIALMDNRALIRQVYEGQRELSHQAYHDSLTGLPNRLRFAEKLDESIADGGPLTLIFVDLDDFKDVNDRFGHAGGDRLLCLAGQRLQGCVRDYDTVARIGGDEFAILLRAEGAPSVFVAKVRAALRRPFAVHGASVVVKASMGVVVPDLTEPHLTADLLLGRADSSMYAGKRQGKDTAVVFEGSGTDDSDFASVLRRAGAATPNSFTLSYQPVVRLSDEMPVAVEALARWTTPDGMTVAPDVFVPAAEAAGLGLDFDVMVMDLACREITAADVELPVHVNIGAARLGTPEFETRAAAILARHSIAPGQVVVEITETVPIENVSEGATAIRRLQALGVRVALDDFGAGYNSLAYLHALPLDMVKLDRTLTDWTDGDHDSALYRSVIGLCTSLHLDVIAEGIETVEQTARAQAAGCTLGQGHLFGYPTPISQLDELLETLRSSVQPVPQ